MNIHEYQAKQLFTLFAIPIPKGRLAVTSDIAMDIARRTVNANTGAVTYPVIVSLNPEATLNDDDGEFTVSLSAGESENLNTGDIFDIQLSDATRTWTVCKGTITVVEDVTGPYES